MNEKVKDISEAKRKRAEGPSGEWTKGLLVNDEGHPKKCLANVLHVLAVHPKWLGVIAYNAFTECTVKLIPPPVREQDGPSLPGEWTEADSTRTAAWFASVVGFEPPTLHVDQAVVSVAERTQFHPVRDYLAGLRWDGELRLDGLLRVYFGAKDSAYARAVGAKWMISAVARVMRPGCQVDCMLVLESGQQGIGKSTGLEALASPQWFSDTEIACGEKDAYQALRGKWLVEFGELSSIKGREVTRVKNFVSARSDCYRPSFGRRTRDFPRQVVFSGTTNDAQYLTDRTGNRRFWPVACASVDVAAIRRDRDALWAEARARFDQGEAWHVDSAELRALCEAEQEERETIDPWVQIVEKWFESPTVPTAGSKTERERLQLDAGITTTDVLLGALSMRPGELGQADATRAGQVLRKLGWKPHPNPLHRDGARVRVYFSAAQPAQQNAETGCADEVASY